MKFKCKKTGKIIEFEPIMINASLVSAQNRKRLFWTNIPNITQPQDRGILLKDILEDGTSDRLKSYCIDANYFKGGSLKNYLEKSRRQVVLKQSESRLYRIGQIGKGGQGDRIYSPEGKSVNLSANGGGRGAKTGLYAISKPVILGNESLQVLKEGRTELGKQSRQEIRKRTGKDSTFRSKGHKAYFGREGIKANCLTTGLGAEGLVVEDFVIRKLTPIECERLQGLSEKEQSCIIRVCKDNQKNSVSVVSPNLKSLKSVGNVEKTDSKENVLSAKKNLSIKHLQTNNAVQSDVLISCEENKIEIYSQNKLIANVSGVELKNLPHRLKSVGDFVHLIVGLNTIVEKTTPFGEAELPQKSSLLVVKENGNNVVNIYGKGITQLAEDAKNDLTILNKLLKSTTLDLSTQKNKEQLIQTLFSYVVLAISGYIPKEIQNQNILTFQIKSKVGYTFGISNTQRYKTLGNAFNVDVVAHILSFIK